MEGRLTLSPDIVSNEIATATRFQKIYRTLFHIFLRNDFPHVIDYKTDLAALNARMALMELNFNKEIQTLKLDITTSILTHSHPGVLPGPSATGPGIPTKPVTPQIPSATPAVIHVEAAINAEDALLQATGPSAAPLGQGISVEAQKARIDVKSDIGLV